MVSPINFLNKEAYEEESRNACLLSEYDIFPDLCPFENELL